MLERLSWLALEVKSLERARSFYEDELDLDVRSSSDREIRYAVGDPDLAFRRPDGVPRGGLHTHYALSIPRAEYDEWWDRLSRDRELRQARFGSSRSLYCDDPEGNCVELGQRDVVGPGVDGLFEVALEVAELGRAERFYERLGFETVDRGAERPRIRMRGPVALELWEPHLGIADARGGVHVDLGFHARDPRSAADAVVEPARDVGVDDGEVTIVDPDGHRLTIGATGSDGP